MTFQSKRESDFRILCLGAHSDDIEIGCGGTILMLLETVPKVVINWIVFGSNEDRKLEAEKSANLFLSQVEQKLVLVHNYKDSYFPYIGAEIKTCFEKLKRDINPDLIFTHHRHDLHQDHRLISELTWNTFRNHLILEYEIPKYDGDMGNPNIFVPLSEEICKRKIRNLFDVFQTQIDQQWFTEDTFWSILRLRGIESNAPEKFAEAFYCRKLVLFA